MTTASDNATAVPTDEAANRLLLGLWVRHPHERRADACYDFADRHPGTLRGKIAGTLGHFFDRRLCRWRERNAGRSPHAVLARHPKWER